MDTQPLIIAVIIGIAYGAIRSYFQDKAKDQKKKRSNPYLESIVVSLAVYLLLSSLVFN